jgi:LDH2 family malate/lactate/ureidoglycolate dehydrogenase
MISLLAGSLNNASVGKETIDFNMRHDLITNTGQAIIAVDPSAFGDPKDFIMRVRKVVNDIKNSTKLPGVQNIHIPGEGADKLAKERSQNGIPISQELLNTLNDCARECGVVPLHL